MSKRKPPAPAAHGDSAPPMPVPGALNADYFARLDGWNQFFVQFQANANGWANPGTGRGIQGKDRNLNVGYNPTQIVPEQMIRALYRGDGIARRIIDTPVDAMFSKGFEVEGDPDGMVIARLEETKMFPELKKLVRFGLLFGGALGIIGADDGQEYDKPLNLARLRNVNYLHVFNRWRTYFNTADLYSDPMDPKFGKPQWYWVQPHFGARFRVHESRTIRVDGNPVDDLTEFQNLGWGDSILQGCFDSLRQLAAAFDSADSILDDFVTETISIEGLADTLQQPDGATLLQIRMDQIAKSRAITNARILDAKNEVFNKVASSIAGLPDVLDRFCNKAASDARMPVTLLFGEEPAGLNSSGTGSQDNWDDHVRGLQTDKLQSPMEYLTMLYFKSQDGYFNGIEPENWKFKFKPLRMSTPKEAADIDKTKAETLAALITANIISEDEARETPDIKDRYNVEGPAPEEPEPPPLPILPGQIPPVGAAQEGQEGKDALDPAAARAGVMDALRYLLRDSRGRLRGDRAQFLEQTVILDRSQFPTAAAAKAWVSTHGFRSDAMTETQRTWRFAQREPGQFHPQSRHVLSPEPGIEVTIGRPLA